MKNTKQELIEKLEELKQELENIENNTDAYDEMLDEYTINIWCLTYYWSQVLKNVDEIAYNWWFSDFIDEELSNKEKEIEELEEEIENYID